MDSRSRFRPHFVGVEAIRDPGTKRERSCGWSFKAVGASREPSTRPRGNPKPSRVESAGKKSGSGSQRNVRTANRHRWARRVASGERVKRGQGTRHNDPVTSEEGMPPLVASFALVAGGGRRESAQATV